MSLRRHVLPSLPSELRHDVRLDRGRAFVDPDSRRRGGKTHTLNGNGDCVKETLVAVHSEGVATVPGTRLRLECLA
ncbi:unnamed protein product, partial [Ixodes pacificus]